MSRVAIIDQDTAADLRSRIAAKVLMPQEAILPFTDFTDLMTQLLTYADGDGRRVITVGYVSADVAIAADRASVALTESHGASPFAGDSDQAIQTIRTGSELVYVGNPNRVTGANFGLTDLRRMSEAVPDGLLVVDEHYFDFYGITALSLPSELDNVIVIRSLTAPFGVGTSEAGYVVANPERIEMLGEQFDWSRISSTVYKILNTTLSNRDALTMRLKNIQDESLRLANTLSKRGIQTRISATDFVLIRVGQPRRVQSFLGRHQVQVENLDDTAVLQNYVRYRVQSKTSNDRLLKAFQRMPEDCYHIEKTDFRELRLHRPQESRADAELPARVAVRRAIMHTAREADTGRRR